MLTLTVADLDIGEPINFTYISITLLVNSLPHKTLPLTSLPIQFTFKLKEDFTLTLRDGSDIIGSVTLNSVLFQNVSQMNVTRWLTLFDPVDDSYDGDLKEDDFENPKIKVNFSFTIGSSSLTSSVVTIKQQQIPRIVDDESKVKNTSEIQSLKHKMQILNENKERVQKYKEQNKLLQQQYNEAQNAYSEEKKQFTITIQQLQLELTDLVKSLQESEAEIEKLKLENKQMHESLQNQIENEQSQFSLLVEEKNSTIQQLRNEIEDYNNNRDQLSRQMDVEKQRLMNIVNDYQNLQQKYQQIHIELQQSNKVQSMLQTRFQNELQQANTIIQQMNKQSISLEGKFNATQTELKMQKEENSLLKEKLQACEQQMKQMQESFHQVEQQESPKYDLNSKSQSMWEQSILQLKQQIQILNDTLTFEKSMSNDLKNQIQLLQNQLQEREEQRKKISLDLLREVEQKHEQNLQESREKTNQLYETKQQIFTLDQERNMLQKRVAQLEEALKEKSNDLVLAQQDLKESIMNLQQVQAKQELQEKLVQKIESLMEENSRLQNDITSLQQNLYYLGEEIIKESQDQDFSKQLIDKINRIITGKKPSDASIQSIDKLDLKFKTNTNKGQNQANSAMKQATQQTQPSQRTNTQSSQNDSPAFKKKQQRSFTLPAKNMVKKQQEAKQKNQQDQINELTEEFTGDQDSFSQLPISKPKSRQTMLPSFNSKYASPDTLFIIFQETSSSKSPSPSPQKKETKNIKSGGSQQFQTEDNQNQQSQSIKIQNKVKIDTRSQKQSPEQSPLKGKPLQSLNNVDQKRASTLLQPTKSTLSKLKQTK